MRSVVSMLSLSLLSLTVGCSVFRTGNERHVDTRVWTGTPKAMELVDHINKNAARIQTLECTQLDVDGMAQGQKFSLSDGALACQKPAKSGVGPNFRLTGFVIGQREVDIGSNGEEFWYWIKRNPQPYVYHCTYTDFRSGKAQIGFPFQPEWIAEALGMGECDPSKTYEVRDGGRKEIVELVERSESPQRQPVFKVTAFHRGNGKDRGPHVVTRYLQDANGKPICIARTEDIQVDGLTGAYVPRIVRLECPMEQMQLKLTLSKVQVNGTIDAARSAALFTRQSLGTLPGYDLARGPDSPSNGIRPAGGAYR